MTRSHRVQFTSQQVEYLMEKTGAESPEEAIEVFITIIESERIDPAQINAYLDTLMSRDGA